MLTGNASVTEESSIDHDVATLMAVLVRIDIHQGARHMGARDPFIRSGGLPLDHLIVVETYSMIDFDALRYRVRCPTLVRNRRKGQVNESILCQRRKGAQGGILDSGQGISQYELKVMRTLVGANVLFFIRLILISYGIIED